MIFIGTPASSPYIVIGQDGLTYDLSTTAYRIDGYDATGNAIVHQITIREDFIFKTNYTVLVGNWTDYFRYRSGNYLGYTPY